MALFQKSVLNKYLREINDSRIAELYTRYSSYFLNIEIQQNIRDSKEEQFQEGFLRELFVNVLGYVINPNPNYNLTTELKNETGAKKADGAIMVGGKAIGVIELKSTSTKDLESIRQQAFDYKANQSECVYVVTSNFEKLRFYIDNAVDFEEFDLFTLSLEQFKLLYLCLHVDSIMAGIPKTAKIASLVKEENVTKKLYADYSVFKEKLFNSIIGNEDNIELATREQKSVATRELAPLQYEEPNNKGTSSLVEEEQENATRELAPLQYEEPNNKGTSSLVEEEEQNKEAKLILFKKTQKLMDRFLFIFFAEDRGLIPPNTISTILTEWEKLKSLDAYRPLYDRFKRHFDYINTGWKGDNYEVFAYNGGLFLPDEILDNITISDEVLFEQTKVLTKYDFDSEVDVNILGHIFEHSLNEIETMNAELEGQQIDLKKTKRKKDGVFYTPKYITKYIVDNTIGKLCEEKKEELSIVEDDYLRGKKGRKKETVKQLETQLIDYRDWLLQITVVDPACGSGAFLNQALEFLIREHRWIDEMTAKLFGGGLVFQDVENSILENNLYGVDINEESVEIAKLSLWLRTAQKGRKLTSLNNNIKCGNSLIDDPEVAGEKVFNWEEEFPKVFANGGFDVVIGNPPYVRADTDNEEFIKQRKWLDQSDKYVTLYEKWDLMVPFYEKSLKLLKDNGLHGFIVSNSITTSKYALKLQEWILKTKNLISIDYYENIEIFKNVGVVPIITIIRNEEPNGVFIKNIHRNVLENNTIINLEIENLETIEPINIFKKDYRSITIKPSSVILNDICYISVGMVINADEKTAKDEFTKDDLISLTFDEIHSKKFVEGKDIKRYEFEKIKFLEWNTDRVPSKLRRQTFPELYEKEKILRGRVTEGTYDDTNIVCNDGVVVFKKYIDLKGVDQRSVLNSIKKNNSKLRDELEIISEQFSIKYILAILNSKFANSFLNNIRRHRLENYFYPDDFRKLPIPIANSNIQDEYVVKVDYIIKAKKEFQFKLSSLTNLLQSDYEIDKLSTKLLKWYELDFKQFVAELKKKKIELSLTEKAEWMSYFNEKNAEAQELKSKIDATDNEIDLMVYKLYDLTYDEVLIVDPKTKISREVYDG